MYSLLTAFESFSVMCSEAALGLFAWSTVFSPGLAGTEDDVVSSHRFACSHRPTGLGSQSPIPTVEPIESQTIREHMVRFIKH